MICPHCNAENREGAKFGYDGAPRLAPPTTPLPVI